MFEIALTEWHVTPEYIIRMWTEEKLQVLLAGRAKRLSKSTGTTGKDEQVADTTLFDMLGYKVPVVRPVRRSEVN